MRRTLKWAVAATAVLIGAWLIMTMLAILNEQQGTKERLDAAQERSDARAEEVAELRGVVDEANRRLRSAGKQPVDAEDVPDGPAILPGLRGLSCVEELGYEECRGPRGFAGRAGAAGRAGVDGENGRPGRDGVDGIDGARGAAGTDGEDGSQGPAGERGESGETGPQGPPGPVGPAGPPGPQGPAGERGERGEPAAGCPNTRTLTYDDDGNPVTPPATTTVCVPA